MKDSEGPGRCHSAIDADADVAMIELEVSDLCRANKHMPNDFNHCDRLEVLLMLSIGH